MIQTGIPEPLSLLFDGRSFFITSGGGGLSLLRVPAEGGGAHAVAVRTGGLVSGMASDDTCLFSLVRNPRYLQPLKERSGCGHRRGALQRLSVRIDQGTTLKR